MIEKDPKDMTVAELLRWAANGEPDKYGYRIVHSKLLSALGGKNFADTTAPEDGDNIRALADQIDAEIEAARREVSEGRFFKTLDTLIEAHDYPNRRTGEVLSEWLERCWLPLPRYEDGEPVQFGDYGIDWDETDECRNPGVLWEATAVDCSGRLLATAFSKIIAVAKTDENGRVKRRAPEVLGADGKPVVKGETVWLTREGAAHAGEFFSTGDEMCGLRGINQDDQLTVANTRFVINGREFVKFRERAAWCPASWLTHTPPDTQERIDRDAVKYTSDYWGCAVMSCEDCPAKIDGKKPYTWFDTRNCAQAQMLDLLRRQRELDARKGGK